MPEQDASRRSFAGSLWFVAAALLGFFLLFGHGRSRASGLVGHPAPDFDLPLVANARSVEEGATTVSMRALRGHPVVLDFWATWCPPCRAEVPILEAASHGWRAEGIVVVGVDTDAPDQGDPRAFAAAHGLSYPIARDADGRVARSFGVDILPTLVVVAADGRVVAVRTGALDEGELGDLVRSAL
jgi:cytochrome c biogenesis protein CcmG/thiol:disulfide interchange protein DsbE